MTVVAAGRGPEGTYNLLLADTGVVAQIPHVGDWLRVGQKVEQWDNDTLITVLGDEGVLRAASSLCALLKPKLLDFSSRATAMASFEGATKYDKAQKALWKAMGSTPKEEESMTTLIVCSRTEVLYWHAKWDGEKFSDLVGPTEVPLGKLVVFYGIHRLDGSLNVEESPMRVNVSEPFEDAIRVIRRKDAEQRRKGHGLSYVLPSKFGGALLHHDSGLPDQWVWPFVNLTEMISKGVPFAKDLLKEPGFAQDTSPKLRDS